MMKFTIRLKLLTLICSFFPGFFMIARANASPWALARHSLTNDNLLFRRTHNDNKQGRLSQRNGSDRESTISRDIQVKKKDPSVPGESPEEKARREREEAKKRARQFESELQARRKEYNKKSLEDQKGRALLISNRPKYLSEWPAIDGVNPLEAYKGDARAKAKIDNFKFAFKEIWRKGKRIRMRAKPMIPLDGGEGDAREKFAGFRPFPPRKPAAESWGSGTVTR